MKNLHEDIAETVENIAQPVMVELFDIDLTAIGGELLHLCNDTNEKGKAIVFGGVAYQPYPIKADGFEVTGQGASPRPKLIISNLLGLATAFVEQYQGAVGAKVTRRQVYSIHLDSENFKNGNPKANPNAQIISHYQIEKYENLSVESATFVLAVPSETDRLTLPRRTIVTGINGYPVLDI